MEKVGQEMSDTQVFGRNHAMKKILGNFKPNDFKRLTERLTDFHCEICAIQLSSDQRKDLIKLCNELIFRLNREIMVDDTSSRVPSASSWLFKRRTSNPED